MTSISGAAETGSRGTGGDGGADGAGQGGHGDIAAQVRAFLVETFTLGNDDFTDDESLLDAGIIDSGAVLAVVAFLEETFPISIADEELVAENLDSVDHLAAFVTLKLPRGG